MTTQKDNEKHWSNQDELLATMKEREAQWEADNKSKQSRIDELEKQNEKLREALTEIWTDSMVDSWQCKLAENVLSLCGEK